MIDEIASYGPNSLGGTCRRFGLTDELFDKWTKDASQVLLDSDFYLSRADKETISVHKKNICLRNAHKVSHVILRGGCSLTYSWQDPPKTLEVIEVYGEDNKFTVGIHRTRVNGMFKHIIDDVFGWVLYILVLLGVLIGLSIIGGCIYGFVAVIQMKIGWAIWTLAMLSPIPIGIGTLISFCSLRIILCHRPRNLCIIPDCIHAMTHV